MAVPCSEHGLILDVAEFAAMLPFTVLTILAKSRVAATGNSCLASAVKEVVDNSNFTIWTSGNSSCVINLFETVHFQAIAKKQRGDWFRM